jgi:glyoxylate reductase
LDRPKVLVSRRWPAAVEAELQKKYDVALNESDTPMSIRDFQTALTKYDAILPTVTDSITAEVFQVNDQRTKFFGNFGVGYSHIDISSAKSAGVVVTNTPDVLSDCTADITLTLMLMAARRASEGEREVRSGRWTGWRPTHLVGTKLTGKILGIIGFGRIGQQVAKRAHHGFGMQVIVQNRSAVDPTILAETNAQQVTQVDDLLPVVDFLSLHCPGGEENRHLIGASQLAKMKSDSILVNTARGEVVDDFALINALKTNEISAAALDVFDGEPNVNPAYLDCENAVLLPHLGSATKETREAMGFRVLENLADFFAGKPPRDRVA